LTDFIFEGEAGLAVFAARYHLAINSKTVVAIGNVKNELY